MKIRRSFVSNSSSCSFVIGCGKITDILKFRKWLSDKNVFLETLVIVGTSDLLEGSCPDIMCWGLKYGLESFRDDRVKVEIDPSKEENFVFFYMDNDEDFWDDESGEYDFTFDISDLPNGQAVLVTEFPELEFVEDAEVVYGAGYNG